MSQRNVAVVTHKHFETGTDLPSVSENISISYGLVKVVEHYLGSMGILYYVDTFKEKWVKSIDAYNVLCSDDPMHMKGMQTHRAIDDAMMEAHILAMIRRKKFVISRILIVLRIDR